MHVNGLHRAVFDTDPAPNAPYLTGFADIRSFGVAHTTHMDLFISRYNGDQTARTRGHTFAAASAKCLIYLGKTISIDV